MEPKGSELIDSEKLEWVSKGRDHRTGALFAHILFLCTYFPSIWKQEYARLLEHTHPDHFYESTNYAELDEEKSRIRASFHGLKYMLGIYDWDEELGRPLEQIPKCYNLPQSETPDEHRNNMITFKNYVFPKLW